MDNQQNLTFENSLDLLKEYKTASNKAQKKQLQRLIVLLYTPVVKKLAYSIARRTTDPVEDIIQVGSIGLLKAIDNFDTTKNDNFKYFATCYITGEIKHYIRDCSSMIKAPRAMKEIAYKITKITEKLTEENGHPPSDMELAEALQITETKVQEYKNVERRVTVISSDTPCDESENSAAVIDLVKDEKQDLKNKIFEDKLLLDTALKELNDQEYDIIQMYFYEELNNQEISLRLNISQKQVAIKLQLAIEQMMKVLA